MGSAVAYKTATKTTNNKVWSASFKLDGKVNRYQLNLTNSNGSSLFDDMLISEGESKSQSYSKSAPKGTNVRVYYRDYDGNFATYSCNGTVNVN